MKKQFTNPYWAIIAVPLAAFLALIYFRVDPDVINLWGRGGVFALLGYISARYVGRAPILMWDQNFAPEARNIVGWAIVLVGFMLQIAYGWLYIAYERPRFLSSQYWGSSFVILAGVGLAIVSTSLPRLPPFGGGKNGLSEIASVAVVIVSTFALFVVSHVPQILTVLRGFFGGLLHAY